MNNNIDLIQLTEKIKPIFEKYGYNTELKKNRQLTFYKKVGDIRNVQLNISLDNWGESTKLVIQPARLKLSSNIYSFLPKTLLANNNVVEAVQKYATQYGSNSTLSGITTKDFVVRIADKNLDEKLNHLLNNIDAAIEKINVNLPQQDKHIKAYFNEVYYLSKKLKLKADELHYLFAEIRASIDGDGFISLILTRYAKNLDIELRTEPNHKIHYKITIPIISSSNKEFYKIFDTIPTSLKKDYVKNLTDKCHC